MPVKNKDAARSAAINKLQEVQQLLFGQTVEQLEENITENDRSINKRVKDLEALVESNSRAFEKALLSTKNELIAKMDKSQQELLLAITELDTKKASRKDISKSFISLQKTYEEIAKTFS